MRSEEHTRASGAIGELGGPGQTNTTPSGMRRPKQRQPSRPPGLASNCRRAPPLGAHRAAAAASRGSHWAASAPLTRSSRLPAPPRPALEPTQALACWRRRRGSSQRSHPLGVPGAARPPGEQLEEPRRGGGRNSAAGRERRNVKERGGWNCQQSK